MNISDLAREAGVATSAVRFYERRGVLPDPGRRSNSYRDYTDDDLCRLRLIVNLRRLGLDVETTGALADLCLSGRCDLMARDLGPLIQDQRAQIAWQRTELELLDRQLAGLEAVLADESIGTLLCASAKGGEIDDELLRAGVPVSAYPGLPVLTRG